MQTMRETAMARWPKRAKAALRSSSETFHATLPTKMLYTMGREGREMGKGSGMSLVDTTHAGPIGQLRIVERLQK